MSTSAKMCALRVPSCHQGLAHATTDDMFGVVEVEAPRFNPCRCGVASRRIVSPLAEINAGSMHPRIRAHSRQNGELGRLWPRGGFDGGVPSSGQRASGRDDTPPDPSGGLQIGAANADSRAIGQPTIRSVDRGVARWRPCEVDPKLSGSIVRGETVSKLGVL